MAEVTMPRLSDTMTEGVIARWLKQPGDEVKRGDVLCEIETDKATMELEAYDSGTLQEILIGDGETVPIGTPIAVIGDGAVKAARSEKPQREAQQEPKGEAQEKPQDGTPPQSGGTTTPAAQGGKVRASPLARAIAQEYGVDLRQVQGSGPGGRIIRENIEQFHQQHKEPTAAPESQPAAPTTHRLPSAAFPDAGATPTPLSRMRQAIATRMSEAKHGTPHIYMTSEIDMEAALALRQQINESGAAPVKISVNDLVIKAAALSLRAYPAFNSSYGVADNGKPAILEHPPVNIAVAVAVDDGLIVPVVASADTKSLGTIAAEVRDLALRARDGRIKQSELEGGTFTVSNLGMFDVVEFAAIITPPQSAVLAVSSVRQIPVVRNNEITIGTVMNVTLSCDHRVTDGAAAAKFLQHFKDLLQSPLKLLV
jgi:pyruvate dehydrogenase E2 component (dihydrolipoamide acetyltransferase)